MNLLQWIVTMRYDNGTVKITTAAETAERAAEIVCAAEHAPARAAVRVQRTGKIRYTADLVIEAECDDDDPQCASGWWSPDWNMWQVSDEPEYAQPDEYIDERDNPDYGEDEPSPAQWLAERFNKRLEGWPLDNGDGTVYSSQDYKHPYEGKSVHPAAHVEGFTPDEITDAVALVKGRKA